VGVGARALVRKHLQSPNNLKASFMRLHDGHC
jgi:hypothetical protein